MQCLHFLNKLCMWDEEGGGFSFFFFKKKNGSQAKTISIVVASCRAFLSLSCSTNFRTLIVIFEIILRSVFFSVERERERERERKTPHPLVRYLTS